MTLTKYQDRYDQNTEQSYMYTHNLKVLYEKFTEGNDILVKNGN